MSIVEKEISRLLRETADKFDAGTSEANEEQILEGMRIFLHTPISKESAAIELGIHPSSFDKLVAEGKIPKGKKKLGWKELRWYTNDIIEAGKKYKIGKYK
jgi:predicted DNA-binding transcriptional regulator AlpA